MERRRIREMLERHRSSAQRAISCASSATVGLQQSANPNEFIFLLNNREPTAITPDLLLKVFFTVDITVGSDRGDHDSVKSIVGYSYTVLRRPETEIIAYHWHPDSAEGSANPHVHFGPASARPDSAVRPGELHKVHFPTGYVALEDVIRLLIEEFGVEPRRSDWEAVLNQPQ